MDAKMLDANVLQRIMSKVIPKLSRCWEWTGAISANGYPVVHVNGKYGSTLYVHQVVCTLYHGTRPDEHEVRHLCNVKTCCNPAHLCWGTKRENSMDRPIEMRKAISNAMLKAKHGR